MIRDWIREENAESVLDILATEVGYELTADERGAIHHGLRETDSEKDQWYEYRFEGRVPISFRLAKDPGAGVVMLSISAAPEVEKTAEVIISIGQTYYLLRTKGE